MANQEEVLRSYWPDACLCLLWADWPIMQGSLDCALLIVLARWTVLMKHNLRASPGCDIIDPSCERASPLLSYLSFLLSRKATELNERLLGPLSNIHFSQRWDMSDLFDYQVPTEFT